MAADASKMKRGRTWEKEETVLLLEKWGDQNIQHRLKECSRKNPIWLEISRYLKASGYEDREYDSCKTRLHTLVSTYRGYKDACNKTGNATPKKQPPFYKELDDILADKPSTRPAVLINSIQMATTTSAEAMDDDIDRDDLSFDDCERDENQLDDENSSCVEGQNNEECPPKRKRRKPSNQELLMDRMDECMSSFMSYQQEADHLFCEAEKERERREGEREEKRRKEDQEFLLKLASILKK
ncbi:hypothetical protein QZH41_011922 [Actinostola sp. cb2023]|nr:hypothetical protein QZH41_011922 [Actinostola sp. cb2023]